MMVADDEINTKNTMIGEAYMIHSHSRTDHNTRKHDN
jgi:hypothetical protein